MTRVFLSTWGQNYNLGDSVLRRGLLQAFRGDGVALHVFVGDNDAGYLSALGLRDTDVLYTERDRWWRAAAGRMLAERTVLVQTAGELVLPAGSRTAGWRSVLGGALARAGGGAAVHLGAGLRDPSAPLPPLERRARRTFAQVAWRDEDTARAFGTGDVAPDWAFGEGTEPDASGRVGPPRDDRSVMAVTLRGDRAPLTATQVARVRAIADEHGWTLRVFTQVRTDADRARELSTRLRCTAPPLVWGDESHADWERRVRDLFARSAAVVSDRAHALIIGSSEGAIPVGLSGASVRKVVRLLRPAGFELPEGDGDELSTYVRAMAADPRSVDVRVAAARRTVQAMAARARALAEGVPRGVGSPASAGPHVTTSVGAGRGPVARGRA